MGRKLFSCALVAEVHNLFACWIRTYPLAAVRRTSYNLRVDLVLTTPSLGDMRSNCCSSFRIPANRILILRVESEPAVFALLCKHMVRQVQHQSLSFSTLLKSDVGSPKLKLRSLVSLNIEF